MKINKLVLFSFLPVFLLLLTCKKDEKQMLVKTGVVSNILTTTADITGEIIDLGNGPNQHGHCFSKTANPNVTGTKTELGVPAGTGGFTSNLTGLEQGTKYYVKAYCSRGTTTVYGSEINFTTAYNTLPTITTTAISAITKNSAVSGGNNIIEGGTPITAKGVCWSLASITSLTVNKTNDGTGTSAFNSDITGLTPGTIYYVRAYATNDGGTKLGNEVTFTTISDTPVQPTVTTEAVTSVTSNSAISGGTITSEGSSSVTARGVCWSTSANPTIINNKTINGNGPGNFVSNLNGLNPGTTYYIRAYATNSAGTSYGNEFNFTTNTVIPTITTIAINSITGVSAKSGGNVISNGGAAIIAKGVCWKTSTGPTLSDNMTNDGIGSDNYVSSLTGLSPGITYYVRAYATTSAGTAYGNELPFTTLLSPTVSTDLATIITTTTATLNGTVNANGQSTMVTFEYGLNASYGSTITAAQSPVSGTGNTAVSATISSLTEGTLYHYRIKGVSAGGTTYGNDQTFTTLCLAPTATTNAATNIGGTTATLNGSVNANGCFTSITFDYGLTTSYGLTMFAIQSPINGTIITNVSADINGLSSGQTYHFRVKAVSSGGTTIGNDFVFITFQPPAAISTSATSIANTTAILNGTINANNVLTIVTFDYGLTPSYGSSVTAAQSPVSGNSITGVNASIAGLTEGTTYHFRVKAVSAGGTSYGEDIPFTTLQAPTAISITPTSVVFTSATLNGTVNAYNLSATVTFQYGLTTSYGSVIDALQSPVSGSIPTNVSASITGLSAGTTYHFRVKAVSIGGTTYGDDIQFSTPCVAPSATTNSESSLTPTTVRLNGSVNANNFSTNVSFEYGTNTNYGSEKTADESPVTGVSNTLVSAGIINLTPNTQYHFRLKTSNCGGIVYGSDKVFSTPCTAPSATTNVVTNRGTTTATFNGTVNANNFLTGVTFDYGTTTSYGSTITATPNSVTGSTNTAVSAGVTGLSPNVQYHYRVNAISCGGTVYGSDQSFITFCTLPSATTDAATNVLDVSATLNGSANANNFSTTVTFLYWITTSDVKTITAWQSPLSGNSNTAVSAVVTGLVSNSIYHYLVKTVNCGGQINGSEMTFTTAPAVGDSYQGGKVAYIFQSGDPGYIAGQVHGIIAAPSDEPFPAAWGCYGTAISGADGTAIGTGNQNTMDIVSGCSTAGIAARLCADKVLNGYSDWFLPSSSELKKLYLNSAAIGGFSNGYYWSSSEFDSNTAWTVDGGSGYQFNLDKRMSTYHVRAVRTF